MRRRPGAGQRRDLMQIAAAVVGSAAAAQVIGIDQPKEREGQIVTEPTDQATNTYETGAPVGVSESADGQQLDVVGANKRRLIVRRDSDGVYVGGCLISDQADLEYLAAFLEASAARPHSNAAGRTAASEGGS